MKKILKLNILLAIILCILCLSKSEVFSMSQEEAGKHIANYAINFWEKHASQVVYSMDRSEAINGYPKSDGRYYMDCVGFSAMVINQALPEFKGQGRPSICGTHKDDSNQFWWPDLAECVVDRLYQNDIAKLAQEGKLMPGDIIANWHHVMVYVGNGKIIHCIGTPLSNEGISEYYDWNKENWWGVCRIRADVVASFTQFNDGGDPHDLGSYVGGLINSIKGALKDFVAYVCKIGNELIGEDEEFPEGTPTDNQNFYYQGIATKVGEEKSDKKEQENQQKGSVFSLLTDFADYVLSSMITGVRGVFVGWTNIVQIGVSEYVAKASGEEPQFSLDKSVLDDSEQLRVQMKESLNLQKIVYNQVPVFDVNVFSNQAGGKDISSNSLTGTVRKLTANWYYIVRTVSIIGLLLVLIYIGIKAAISSAAEDKAMFKGMLVNWLVAFIVVFFMHYIILFILQVNESFVNIFASIGGKLDLYETIRNLTWDPKPSVSFLAALIYIALVYYLIKFVIIYFKRLFVTIILIVMAPFVSAKYAYDKVKKGSNGTSLGKWIKEFTFSVFTQTIHALIYTVLMTVIVDITIKGADGIGIAFAKFLLAIIFFRFMTQAEKLLREIFNLAGSEGGSNFGSIGSVGIGTFIGASTIYKNVRAYAVPMYEQSKEYLNKLIKNNEWGFFGEGLLAKYVKKGYTSTSKYIEDAYIDARKEQLINKYNLPNKERGKTIIGKKLDRQLREEYHMRFATIGNALSTSAKTVGGVTQAFVGLPIFLTENTLMGTEWMLAGAHTVFHAAGAPIKGYRKPKDDKKEKENKKYTVPKKVAELIAGIGSVGMYNVFKNIKEVYGQRYDILFKDKRSDDIQIPFKPEQIKLLIQAENYELSIREKLKALKKFEFGGDPLKLRFAMNDLIQTMEQYQYVYNKIDINNYIKDYRKDIKKYSLGLKDMLKIGNHAKDSYWEKKNNNGDKTGSNQNKPNEYNTAILEQKIKSEVKMGLVRDISNGTYETRELTKQLYQEMKDELENTMKNLEQEEIGTGISNEAKKNATQLAIMLLDQKQKRQEKFGILDELRNKSNEQTGEESEEDANDEPIKEPKDKQKLQTLIAKIRGEESTNIEENTNSSEGNRPQDKPMSLKEVLDQIQNGNNNVFDIGKLKEEDRKNVEKALEDVISDKLVDNAISHMDADQLTNVMEKSLKAERKEIFEKVDPRFKDIARDITKISELNDKMSTATYRQLDHGEIVETGGEPMYTSDELINILKKGIGDRDNN